MLLLRTCSREKPSASFSATGSIIRSFARHMTQDYCGLKAVARAHSQNSVHPSETSPADGRSAGVDYVGGWATLTRKCNAGLFLTLSEITRGAPLLTPF